MVGKYFKAGLVTFQHKHTNCLILDKEQNKEDYYDKHNLYSKLNSQLTNLYIVRLEHVLM